MRTIAGALLIVAASIFFAASLIVRGIGDLNRGVGGDGYLLACVLGLFGLILLLFGICTECRQ